MAKKTSSLFNMLLTLVIITIISGFLLGYVNEVTKEPKAKVQAARKMKALQEVLPAFDNNLLEDVLYINTPKIDSLEVYVAKKAGNTVGYAIEGSSNKGFGGLVKTIVGFTLDGTINNISVLEQKETPGLGTKMKNVAFLQQFLGKNPSEFDLRVKKDGGQVDALTGATISSRAFNETITNAYQVFKKVQQKEKQ